MLRSPAHFLTCWCSALLTVVLGGTLICSQQAALAAPAAFVPDDNAEPKKEGEEGKEKEEAEKPDESKPAEVKREAAKEPPSPVFDEIKWDDDGAVQFNFHNQPWKNVLQWIASASHLSFDWQTLPGDTLNLTTTRSYSLEEARDLLNRHLLTRGYTLLQHGEILSAVKTSEIKSSLVPRVAPEDLKDQPPHSIVKTSFDLDWLIAEEAVEELGPMLSAAGKIHQLRRTNRLEVIDTAASLNDIWQLLKDEQSQTGQEQLVRPFRLKHRRASDVISLLRPLVGLKDPSAAGAAMDPRMMQQMMQQIQRQMQQQAGKNGGGGKKEIETKLVLNQRENMILAVAAPDKMAILEKAITQIDVPGDREGALARNMRRMKIHQLHTVSPQTVVDLLDEVGDLSPGTTLKVDKEQNAIVAIADLADQATITLLLERLDSSGREIQVLRLRRLDAEYVAGTIRNLMGPEKKKEDNNRRYWWSWRDNDSNEEKKPKNFRVEADLQENRLLVYANPVEMDEIRRLLQKLGELPDPNAPDKGYRVFELGPSNDPRVLRDRLKQLWQRPNQLEFQLPQEAPVDETKEQKEQDQTADLPDKHRKGVWTRYEDETLSPPQQSDSSPADDTVERFFRDASGQPAESSAAPGPPIRISVSEDGRLIATCDDPQALLEFEDLLQHVAKPATKYRVFKLNYVSPFSLTLTLEEYFEDQEESEGVLDWWGYYREGNKKKDGDNTLGKRRIPQFIYDTYTSTILVRNADARQLQTIEELIELYDVPEPADTRSMRLNKSFSLKNAKAETVSQVIKDVFRDLLSGNDKALEQQGKKEQSSSSSGGSWFGRRSDSDDDKDEEPIRFKGLLSIGVDPESNTLMVSATAGLMNAITAMVEELDQAAVKSSGVRILKLNPSVDLGLLQHRLAKIVGSDSRKPVGQPPTGQATPNGQPATSQPATDQPQG